MGDDIYTIGPDPLEPLPPNETPIGPSVSIMPILDRPVLGLKIKWWLLGLGLYYLLRK